MFRGALQKRYNGGNPRQKIEVKVAMASAALGFGMGLMGAIKALQTFVFKTI